jgi:hypothetical protein
MESAVEAVKLKPAQIALLFALALPLAALPTLYIYMVDPVLFDKLEVGKLLLLAFSASAPIFGIFFGVGLVVSMIDPNGKDGKPGDDILGAFYIASMITALIYLLFAIDLIFNGQKSLDPVRKALVLPVILSAFAGYAILMLKVCKNKKKSAKLAK